MRPYIPRSVALVAKRQEDVPGLVKRLRRRLDLFYRPILDSDWVDVDDMTVVVKPKEQRRGKRQKVALEASNEAFDSNTDATTLDRVHAGMLLQASGRANALRRLLESEGERGPDFPRLANALSALYPKGSEEKRLLDAMLLAVPR
jgi:hypothetical protein